MHGSLYWVDTGQGYINPRHIEAVNLLNNGMVELYFGSQEDTPVRYAGLSAGNIRARLRIIAEEGNVIEESLQARYAIRMEGAEGET